jgi:hypothetical protein
VNAGTATPEEIAAVLQPEVERLIEMKLIFVEILRELIALGYKARAYYAEAFQFPGSYHNRWACIGSSTPPLFMRASPDRIRRNVLPADTGSNGFTAA